MLPAGIYLLYKHKQRQRAEEATSGEQTELPPEPAETKQAIEQQRPGQVEAAMPPPETDSESGEDEAPTELPRPQSLGTRFRQIAGGLGRTVASAGAILTDRELRL